MVKRKTTRKGHWRTRPDGTRTWVKPHSVVVHSSYKVPVRGTKKRPLKLERTKRKREIQATITKPTYALQDPKTGKMLGSVPADRIKGKINKSEF